MIREANHAAESKDPYPRYWSFLTVLLARELEAGAPTFLLRLGILRLRGNLASRNFHSAQDDRTRQIQTVAGANFSSLTFFAPTGSGSSNFSAAASLFC
jgi:hypothetical protein